jgi:hypothetical protein
MTTWERLAHFGCLPFWLGSPMEKRLPGLGTPVLRLMLNLRPLRPENMVADVSNCLSAASQVHVCGLGRVAWCHAGRSSASHCSKLVEHKSAIVCDEEICFAWQSKGASK